MLDMSLLRGVTKVIAVDAQIQEVWNPETRALAAEAWQCYNSGALRASITITWTAVTTDLIAKIGSLADDGDRDAINLRDEIEQAQAHGLTPQGTIAMQKIENKLLDSAQLLELIDSVDKRALERIREDRNLCVHPSLRVLDAPYQPLPDVARANLSVALDALLIHPPTQGKKILDVFKDYTCDPGFTTSTPTHIQRLFYDRVRTNTRRNIASLAAKHAVGELDVGGRLSASAYADRCAHVLAAVAERDRVLVREAMQRCQDRYRQADTDTQRRALSRLGDQDYFWTMLDDSLVAHVGGLVPQVPADPYEALDPTTIAVLSLVGNTVAREHLPQLEQRFEQLGFPHRSSVMSDRPSAYFVPHIPALLRTAYNFRAGERAGEVLRIHSQYLTIPALQQSLSAWSANVDCRMAADMPPKVVSLLTETAHLGSGRVEHFRRFLGDVRAAWKPGDPEFYLYDDLETALNRAP
ncbi:hypothetical protein [Gordonia amicalis]|uniref:Uncharacterized protein n=1 Tax=Gordonia amicalis TaxID=89053 RepID=A0ABU4DJT7_9ACTN|nr:hypothetical protein [Gordonia amicalis]MDV6310005.1 hypothetical protein [Gordonia amicalis]